MGKREQDYLPYNIKAIGKNIKWGRGKGTEISGNKIKIEKKMWVGKNIKL